MDEDQIQTVPWNIPLIHENIQRWFNEGILRGARYLIVYQDTFDMNEPDMGFLPYYAKDGDDARAFAAKQLSTSIDLLVDIFDLSKPFGPQIAGPLNKDLDAL